MKNLPISGPILQGEALSVAERLGNTTFKASVGWLNSFRERHGITFNQVCGGAKDIDEESVDSWKEKLQTLTSGYDSKDIYNGDETGLFFFALFRIRLYVYVVRNVLGGRSQKRD